MEEREDTIYLVSKINELFATTEITQYFTNGLDNAIELSIRFPIKEEINITKFTITIDDKIYISKVIQKEKAEEKYTDTIASGNIGIISKFEDDDMNFYTVNIGNINPKQNVKLNSVFMQMIGAQDMSYEFAIMEKYPIFNYEGLNESKPNNKIIKANFIIETQSKITRLIAPFYDDEAKKYSTYEVKFNDDYKKAEIVYVKNPINNDNNNSENKDRHILSSFSLLFRTEKMNNPMLYYQYNPEFKETSYAINYIYSSKSIKEIPIPDIPDQDNKISYYSKYQENKVDDSLGLFIFLVDQSGSMSGQSMELVKETLLEVFKSLKSGSYFQLIGFGSSYKKYNEEPIQCKPENINTLINIVKELRADMGGTNISGPLEEIYKSDKYSNINLSKNIFLLTDGQVNDIERCIDLITINSNKFKLHAFGIGNYFDRTLIERSGKLGKGSSSFVENVSQIKDVVLEILNKYLRPYLYNINFDFINYQNNQKNNIICCTPVNDFTYQDEIMNYSFILDEKNKLDIDNLNDTINVEITGKENNNNIKEIIKFEKNKNIIKLKDGDEMIKMIVGKAIKNNKELIKDTKKEIEFATKYQILSKNTALFCEIENNQKVETELTNIKLNDKQELNNNNTQINDLKPRRHRRSNHEYSGRNFICECGKAFLSYPALYNHKKTKHPESFPDYLKRGRGRARKLPPKAKNDFETNKYDTFFNKDGRSPINEEEININKLIEEVFDFIYKSPLSNKLFSHPKNFKENPVLENLFIKKEIDNKSNELKTCDDAFYEYLITFMEKTNNKFFALMLKFVLLYKECYDIFKNKDKKEEKKKTITNTLSPEDLPDLANEFYSEFVDNNNYFDNEEEKSEIIEIIQHFNLWLFKNNYSKSKLSIAA